MVAQSSPVVSGQQATADQYNDLRTDVLDPALGHAHDGVGGVNLGELRLQMFGDGLDGDVTIAADTGIIRDMYYRNLTVNAGATLITNGFRIFIQEVLTLDGRIAWNFDEHIGWATLTASMTAGTVTAVTWASAKDLSLGRQGCPTGTHGYVLIGNEIMWALFSAASLTPNKRGQKGTIAAAHSIGDKVLFLPHGSDAQAKDFGSSTAVVGAPTQIPQGQHNSPTPGAAGAAASVAAAGTIGGAGNDNSASLIPTLRVYAQTVAGAGGAGGAGPAGVPTGGAGGGAGKSAQSAPMGGTQWGKTAGLPVHDVWAAIYGPQVALFAQTSAITLYAGPFGGNGGGGGSGGSGAASGGGRGGFGGNQGMGGQLVLIAARDLVGAGAIQARGQPGGDGSDGWTGTGTNGGGGGGGGGGVGGPGGMIYLITANRGAWTGTTDVAAGAGGAGGAGGAKTGTAIAGNAGGTGAAGIDGLLVDVMA